MHIETHAKETTRLMMDLYMSLSLLEARAEADMAKVTRESIVEVAEKYRALSDHLFGAEVKA